MSFDSLKKLEYFYLNYDDVIVCGCFPAIGIHKFKYNDNIYTIKNDALQEIEKYFPPKFFGFIEIKDGNDIYFDTLFNNDVFLIRISNGCLGNCSYCAIRNAIGALKSKSLPCIIEEVEFAINKNYSYIRLIADDGGAYGIDLKSNIINLLNKLSSYSQIKGIEFEISPKWILEYKEEFINFINNNSRLSFKITVPMQSASKKILKHMNRIFNIDEFDLLLTKLNNIFNIFFITHIITGYPTETQEDQNITIKFLINHKFNQINIFPFTLHPNSKIASLYKTDNSNVHNKTNYMVDRLCDNGYDIIDSSKSESLYWQHVVLKLKDSSVNL